MYFSTKFVRISKRIKKGEHRQWLLKLQTRSSSCETTIATTRNHIFFNFKEWFIYDRERLIYDKIWYIYHAIFLLLKVRLISTSPLFFLQFSYFSQNPNTLLCNRLLALLWILVSFWLDTNRICTVKAFINCLPFTGIARY